MKNIYFVPFGQDDYEKKPKSMIAHVEKIPETMEEAMKMAYQFDPEIDENYIMYLMKIRVFTGLHYFAENKNEYTKMNPKAAREILKKYFIANEKINIYKRNRNKIKEKDYTER